MIIANKFNGYSADGRRLYNFGGGGGGQTTSTVQNTNVPEYARPYVETMLGATQEQLFQGSRGPDVTNPETGEVTPGTFNITGFKPYQAYGGTYDAQGNQLSYDPGKAIAGFSPAQIAAQQGITGIYDPATGKLAVGPDGKPINAGLQLPEGFNTASKGLEDLIGAGSRYTAPKDLGYTAKDAIAADAGAYQEAVGTGYTASEAAAEKTAAAKLGLAPEAAASQFTGPKDVTTSPLNAFQMNAAQSTYAPNLQQYNMGPAPTVSTKSFVDKGTAESYMSPYIQNVLDVQNAELERQAGIASTQRGAQAARAGAFGGARQAIENAEANRNLAMMKNMNTAQGNQQAFQQAMQQFNAEQGYGLQGQIANQQAGLTVGQQNLGAQLGIQQLGTQTNTQMALANLSNQQQAAVQNQAAQLQAQGMSASNALQAALANQSTAFNTSAQNAQLSQQTALANQAQKSQYGLTQGQFDQQANMQTSAQAQQAALANAAAQNAASQFGAGAGNQASLANQSAYNQMAQYNAGLKQQTALSNQAASNQAAQFGAAAGNQASLANQSAYNQMAQYNAGLKQQAALSNQAASNQAAQFGAAQGLASAQTAAQYGLAGDQLGLQASGQLGSLAGQQLTAQQGILGLQNQVGAQQQALEQQKINQAMQDYANAQQYPLMQLGTMSNMLRGLPMQASTTNQYQAAPNQLTQAIGTIGSGASIYNALKPTGGAAGGLPSEFKYAKGGGIMSYDMGGEVESQLENMDEKGLAAQAKESSSPSIRRMAQRILRERQMSKQPQGTGPMGVQYQAAQPPMPSMRAGGIIAFAKGETVYGGPSSEAEEGEEEARAGMQERLAMPPAGGIMGVAPQTAPAPAPLPAPTAGGAVQQAAAIPDFMKAQYADAETRANAPLASFMAERQAAMREAGVADVSEGQQKQRAEMMAEKANMAEEKERQRHLRLAEFFATWGSTPGPTLVAGMNALKKSVPGIISDEKEQKKARREIDKSIADLDNATRLEKRGEVDAALALKLKAAEEMKALNAKLIDYQSKRESDASSSAASKYRDDTQFRSEQLRAENQRLDRLAMRETANDNRAFSQYQTAVNQEQRVISKIIDQAKTLDKDYATIKTAEMNMSANDGKLNPALVPGYEAAKKKVAEQEAIWNKQKEEAAKNTDLAYSRIRIRPEASPTATGAPAPAGGLETRDFPAPTAAHIAALKANPSQRAAFDDKFGPGAANEYAGR